jgi:hypothetical protein
MKTPLVEHTLPPRFYPAHPDHTAPRPCSALGALRAANAVWRSGAVTARRRALAGGASLTPLARRLKAGRNDALRGRLPR